MRKCLLSVLCLVAAGCGVSKDVYRGEVVKSQELSARVEDLESRLKAETQQRQGLEVTLREREEKLSGLRAKVEQVGARGEDLESRLTASAGRETGLRADLDLCRSALRAAEGELEAEKAARAQEKSQLQAEVEGCREETATLQTRVAVLDEAKQKADREKQEKLDEISRTYEGLVEGLKDEVEKGRVTISQLQGKLTVNMLDEILFDSGSVVVKGAGQSVLKRLGELLQGAADKAIVIEGHTDDVPISQELAKRFPTNWELSTARAASVVRYLQEEVGIGPDRLSAVGFGSFRPVASNDTVEGRARNRRIEVKLVPLEAPLFSPPSAEAPETPAQGDP